MSPEARTIDVNADLGEGCPNDEALLDLVTSASLSCGAHAGDRPVILATLRAAKARGVVVGAHPGFADREGFGRRERRVASAEVERLILEQVETLTGLAGEDGVIVRFVKPHGALYNQAQREPPVAEGVVRAVARLGLPVLGQPGSVLETLASEAGLRFIAEGFPDRRYRDDGRLVPRSEPGAVLHDRGEIEAQALRLVDQGVATLCIHGDDPRAVENARSVRSALRQAGVAARGFG